MINDFIIKAQKENNQLYILLDGIFMKSEMELIMYLIKKEIRKLKPCFEVSIDIHNMDSGALSVELQFLKFRKILKLMGAGTIKFVGLSNIFVQNEHQNGGDYSHENEWFF